jgi:hypothetical protein
MDLVESAVRTGHHDAAAVHVPEAALTLPPNGGPHLYRISPEPGIVPRAALRDALDAMHPSSGD